MRGDTLLCQTSNLNVHHSSPMPSKINSSRLQGCGASELARGLGPVLMNGGGFSVHAAMPRWGRGDWPRLHACLRNAFRWETTKLIGDTGLKRKSKDIALMQRLQETLWWRQRHVRPRGVSQAPLCKRGRRARTLASSLTHRASRPRLNDEVLRERRLKSFPYHLPPHPSRTSAHILRITFPCSAMRRF
jgi:hypothetical protein